MHPCYIPTKFPHGKRIESKNVIHRLWNTLALLGPSLVNWVKCEYSTFQNFNEDQTTCIDSGLQDWP